MITRAQVMMREKIKCFSSLEHRQLRIANRCDARAFIQTRCTFTDGGAKGSRESPKDMKRMYLRAGTKIDKGVPVSENSRWFVPFTREKLPCVGSPNGGTACRLSGEFRATRVILGIISTEV